MKPDVRTVRQDDLRAAGGDIPAWVDVLLQVYNSNFEAIGKTLLGNLTFADNLSCATKTFTFTHATELIVNPASSRRVTGMLPPVDSSGYVIDSWTFTRKTDGTLGVTINFLNGVSSGSNATRAACTIVILLG